MTYDAIESLRIFIYSSIDFLYSFFSLTIITLQIILVISVICLIIYFLVKKWKSFHPAKKVKIVAEIQSIIIFFELVVAGILLLSIFNEKLPLIKPIFRMTYIQNLTTFVFSSSTANGSTISLENLSGILGIASVVIVYFYFFYVFSRTGYFTERTEIQEKYAAIFWSPIVLLLFGGLVILPMDNIIFPSANPPVDSLFFLIAIFTVFISIPLPLLLRRYFYNRGTNIDSREPTNWIFQYDFIDTFRKIPTSATEDLLSSFISDFILALTILLALMGYLLNCNLFMLLIVESCLLIALFWISQLSLIPKRKMTVELKECDASGRHVQIANIFIITDSQNGYFIVLDEKNTLSQIMKDSIQQLIYQNE